MAHDRESVMTPKHSGSSNCTILSNKICGPISPGQDLLSVLPSLPDGQALPRPAGPIIHTSDVISPSEGSMQCNESENGGWPKGPEIRIIA